MPYATRSCSTCQVDFKPSSGHKSCPTCRSKATRVPCTSCGELCTKGRELCANCFDRTGNKNPNWKGGVSFHSKGYVYQRVFDHPKMRNGYVLQHVLVMEETLGRNLLPGENVHHKNGVKDDNRPENLELWIVNQPAGQRPEDLVAWAKVILERYEPKWSK